MCYINEIAFDEDPIKEEGEEEEEGQKEEVRPDSESAERGRFPRSKSDWEAFRNPSLLTFSAPQEERTNKRSEIVISS